MKSLRSDYPLYTRKSYGSAVGSRGGAEKDADRPAIWSPSTKKETHDGGSNRRSAGITEHSWQRIGFTMRPGASLVQILQSANATVERRSEQQNLCFEP